MEESVVLQSDNNPFPYLNRIISPKLLNFPCFNRIIFSVLTVYQVSAVLLPCLNYVFPSVTPVYQVSAVLLPYLNYLFPSVTPVYQVFLYYRLVLALLSPCIFSDRIIFQSQLYHLFQSLSIVFHISLHYQ